MDVRQIDREAWAEAMPMAGTEVFHEPAALAVLEAHTDAEIRCYVAEKGGQAVGALPVFVDEKPVGRTITSPPLSLGIPRLGPVIDPNSPKRRKGERINHQLTEAVLTDLGADERSTLVRLTCPLAYDDPRPYRWQGLQVEPEFTYVVDCGDCPDLESVMCGFSKSLRNEMRRLDEVDVRIETEGVDSALQVYEDVVEQYAAYDDEAPLTRPFVRDLLAGLPADRWRVYVARDPDGIYLSGIIVLYSDDLAYYWQGGVTATYDHVSVNTLLHGAILRDLVTDPTLESITGYDLVGANTERLCEYKGKFNGTLRPYYVVESAGLEMALAKSAYRRIAGSLK